MNDEKPLSRYTTFGIGGSARVTELTTDACLTAHFTGGEVILGGGSNVLAADAGVIEPVLINRRRGVTADGARLYVTSGEPLSALSRFALSACFSGLEWAEGIPGSVGGAVVMNAGAFGGCMADILDFVDVYDGTRFYRLTNAECGFSYRQSVFQNKKLFISGVGLRLSPGDTRHIGGLMWAYKTERRAKQPTGKCAGSVFKAADRPAGYYIERAGLKGRTVGGAAVSKQHANFIMNLGTATASDVLNLIEEIEDTVREKYGVRLTREICLIGEFNGLLRGLPHAYGLQPREGHD